MIRLPGNTGQAVWKVLRGGSFNNNRNNARCAYRNRNQPDNRNNNIGFSSGITPRPRGMSLH